MGKPVWFDPGELANERHQGYIRQAWVRGEQVVVLRQVCLQVIKDFTGQLSVFLTRMRRVALGILVVVEPDFKQAVVTRYQCVGLLRSL